MEPVIKFRGEDKRTAIVKLYGVIGDYWDDLDAKTVTDVIDAIDADEYLKMYTRYVLNLLLNYTPRNIKYNFNDLLSFATPKLYPELQKNLLKIEDNVDKLRVSSIFYPSQIIIDREKNIITIGGVRRQFANFSKIDETQRNYYLRYQIDNGRFYIANIQEQEIADENENENPIH